MWDVPRTFDPTRLEIFENHPELRRIAVIAVPARNVQQFDNSTTMLLNFCPHILPTRFGQPPLDQCECSIVAVAEGGSLRI
jgi:hypothetical protein